MPHILVIEDYRDNRDVAELILRDAGYTVSSAGDGLSGIAVAIQRQPDLILMDLALPVLNGWEATRRLTAHPATQHIPVVAFTAHIGPDALTRAYAAGCIASVAKPFEIEVLLRQLAVILTQHRRPDRQRAAGEH
jgi:two-component system cell cycle response regulator DivK